MKKLPAIIAILTLVAAQPAANASLADFFSWLKSFGGSSSTTSDTSGTSTTGGSNEPIVVEPPTEQEVEEVNQAIVESAAQKGHTLNPEQLADYSRRLALTLKQLSPEQSERVFEGS